MIDKKTQMCLRILRGKDPVYLFVMGHGLFTQILPPLITSLNSSFLVRHRCLAVNEIIIKVPLQFAFKIHAILEQGFGSAWRWSGKVGKY